MKMRTFLVKRIEDVSGVSGVGIIAEGVQFHDGLIVISWFGRYHITETAPDIQTWLAVHGHGGKTTIEWLIPSVRSGQTDQARKDAADFGGETCHGAECV